MNLQLQAYLDAMYATVRNELEEAGVAWNEDTRLACTVMAANVAKLIDTGLAHGQPPEVILTSVATMIGYVVQQSADELGVTPEGDDAL